MQIESLKYFVTLAETGSFARAARSSFLTKQGLNKAVSTLEREFGTQLVTRGRQGVALTESGELFLEKVKPVLGAYDELLDSICAETAVHEDSKPLVAHVTYYSAQIATASFEYVKILRSLSYIEEPFDKIVERARVSDGDELDFVDLTRSSARLLAEHELAFLPVLESRVGFVVCETSPLAAEHELRCPAMRDVPIAYNAQREIANIMDWIFEECPLADLRLGVASPRMTLEWLKSNPNGAAFYDSFGFYLSCKDPSMPTEGLRFVPLASKRAVGQAGFLYRKGVKQSLRAENAVNVLQRYLHSTCASYYDRYPL